MSLNVKYIEHSHRAEVSATLSDGTVSEVALVYDDDVLSGNASLSLDIAAQANYNVIGLNTILVNHTHSGNVKKCRNDVIGFKNVFCEVCGARYGSSSAVTETSEIDIAHKLYGASIKCVERDPGKCSIANVNGAIKYTFGENNNPEHYELTLPRIAYSLYETVTYTLTETQGWLGLGFTQAESDAHVVSSGSNARGITLVVTRVSDTEATAVFTYTGKEGGTDSFSVTKTITDYDELHGHAGMKFYGKSPFNNTENRVLNITNISVTPVE